MSGNRKALKGSTVNLLWAVAAGHCELCGSDVTTNLLSPRRGKYGQVAHIEAYSPGGARYNKAQSIYDCNSIDNLMLLCADCHKKIDENPSEYGVDFLKSRKRHFESSVRRAVASVGPTSSDIILLAQPIGEKENSILERDWERALIDAGLNAGQARQLNASAHVPCGCGPDTLRALEKRIKMYYELVHHDKSRRTGVFAIAPQPVLIGLGTLLSDVSGVDIYQKRRDGDGWSWATEGPQNSFECTLLREGSGDCAIVVSVSGSVPPESYVDALPDSVEAVYELRALRPGQTAMLLKSDLDRFKEAAIAALFRIHEGHPDARSLHVLPAMPVSACVSFGMAWNSRLIPELVLYEKENARFSRAVSIGSCNGEMEYAE